MEEFPSELSEFSVVNEYRVTFSLPPVISMLVNPV
jgi:hypothetical protein